MQCGLLVDEVLIVSDGMRWPLGSQCKNILMDMSMSIATAFDDSNKHVIEYTLGLDMSTSKRYF
jgi:hypothetical protein